MKLTDDEIIKAVWDNFQIELRRNENNEFMIWLPLNLEDHEIVRQINKFIISITM